MTMERITHSDIRGRYGYGIAYNVKQHGAWKWAAETGTDAQREQAWEYALDDWWVSAADIAKELGFSGVTCAGRSGGYIAPLWDGQPVGPDLFDWYGSGEYQDDFNKAMNARLVAFESRLSDLLKAAPPMFADSLAFIIQQDAEDAEDAANAATERAQVFADAAGCLRALHASNTNELAAKLERYA